MQIGSPITPLPLLRAFLLLVVFISPAAAQIFLRGNPGIGVIDTYPQSGSGFTVRKVDTATSDALAEFDEQVAKSAWEKAFAALSKITESGSASLVAAADGFYLPMRTRLRQLMVNLPPAGKEAYRLFNDARAKQQLAQLDASRDEDSASEIARLQELLDKFFITSVGDQIADRLGDARFQSGDFSGAVECWSAILSDYPDTSLSPARIAAKRAVALSRAGMWDDLAAASAQARAKYSDQSIKIGGRDLTVAALLDELPKSAPDAPPTSAPLADFAAPVGLPASTDPLWQCVFSDDIFFEQLQTPATAQVMARYGFNPSAIVPYSSADERRIYLNWFGIGVAIDAATGKMLWRTEPFSSLAARLQQTAMVGYDTGEATITAVPGTGRVLMVSGATTSRSVPLAIIAPPQPAPLPVPPVVPPPAAAQPPATQPARGARATSARSGRPGAPAPVPAPAPPVARGRVVIAPPAARIIIRPGSGQLSCRSSSDGRPIWSSEAVATAGPLSTWNFLGEPLVQGDCIYITALPLSGSTVELNLLAIALSDGTLLWKIPIGTMSPGVNPRGLIAQPRPVLKLASDMLYLLTGNGALAAVNLPARRIEWVYTYPSPPIATNLAGLRLASTNGGQLPTTMHLVGSMLYFKERAATSIYAVDVAGPSLKWRRDVDNDAGILAVDSSWLYLLNDELAGIDLRTRQMRWTLVTPLGKGLIRPFITGSHAYIYGSAGVYEIDLLRHNRITFTGYERGVAGGNVLRMSDKLITVSNRRVTAYAIQKQE